MLNKIRNFLKNIGRSKKVDKKTLGRDYNTNAKIANDAYSKDRRSFDGYQYVKGYSNDEHALYLNPKTKEAKIGIRGTANLKDVGTDVKLAFGGLKSTDRFKREDKYVDRIKNQFPDYKVDLTGHSLGASLSSELAKKHNTTGSGFNAGFGIKGNTNNPNFNHYRTGNDPVSLLGKLRGQKFTTVSGSGHSANNFV